MEHLVIAAAQAAQAKSDAIAELKVLQDAFNEQNAILIARVVDANLDEKKANAELRGFALDRFEIDGEKKPHDAVTIKMFATVECDEEYALEWAKKYAHCVLTIDEYKYKFLLKSGLFDDMPGRIGEEAKPTIKRDLSAYLPPSEHD